MRERATQKQNILNETDDEKPHNKKGGLLSVLKKRKKETGETIIEEGIQKTNPLMQTKNRLFAKLSKTPNVTVQKDSLPPVQENITEKEVVQDFSQTTQTNKITQTKQQDTKTTEVMTQGTPLEHKEEKHPVQQQVNSVMKLQKDLMRPLRTYKDDIVEAVRNKKSSLISITAAEQNERAKRAPFAPTPKPPKKTVHKITLILLSFGLIIAGILLVVFFYTTSNTETVSKDNVVSKLLFTETDGSFEIESLVGKNLLTALNDNILRTNIQFNTFKNLQIIEKTPVGKHPVSASDFLTSLNTKAPGSLIRSLEPNFMVGIHSIKDNEPFFILKTRSFDTAFAGMLNWEQHMSVDLNPLFGTPVTNSLVSIREKTQQASLNAQFVDVIIKSRDTRVLFNERGEIAILYTFLNKDTLIITTNKNTFEEIFTRISSIQISR